MQSYEAETSFEQALARQGRSIDDLLPEQALHEMVSFYRAVRADDCSLDQDGDMLLLEWGTYDWGDGLHFFCAITRQFMPALAADQQADGDPPMLQLAVRTRFESAPALTALGEGSEWVSTPDEVPRFLETLNQLIPPGSLSQHTVQAVELTFGDVE
jgi:hypothetical protein